MGRLTTITLVRIIIMIISKILSPSEISGSHTSPGKIYLPVPSQGPAWVSQGSLDPAASVGRRKITHWVRGECLMLAQLR